MTNETSNPGLGPQSDTLLPDGGLGPHSTALESLETDDTSSPAPADPGTAQEGGAQPDGGLGPHS